MEFASTGRSLLEPLRERGEYSFHQLASRRVVNRLGRGAEGDAERLQMRPQREMVVLVPRESGEVEDDDELDPALVRAAELQELLKLGAVSGLRALALLSESREHVEALALAVREEAQYHLAVALLDRGVVRYRREVQRLLTRAVE